MTAPSGVGAPLPVSSHTGPRDVRQHRGITIDGRPVSPVLVHGPHPNEVFVLAGESEADPAPPSAGIALSHGSGCAHFLA